jgi:hypothetical protein
MSDDILDQTEYGEAPDNVLPFPFASPAEAPAAPPTSAGIDALTNLAFDLKSEHRDDDALKVLDARSRLAEGRASEDEILGEMLELEGVGGVKEAFVEELGAEAVDFLGAAIDNIALHGPFLESVKQRYPEFDLDEAFETAREEFGAAGDLVVIKMVEAYRVAYGGLIGKPSLATGEKPMIGDDWTPPPVEQITAAQEAIDELLEQHYGKPSYRTERVQSEIRRLSTIIAGDRPLIGRDGRTA